MTDLKGLEESANNRGFQVGRDGVGIRLEGVFIDNGKHVVVGLGFDTVEPKANFTC